ncbi:prosaposin isoform X2 [Ictalurus furcatus]|uniref:prosaposin isoform X2 n=1 Tax=Ictalurus furcatus TaxID=66913 RepID=UPI0023507E6F|nr:prosaposin isoform X2 [Ictalurus furcatus]
MSTLLHLGVLLLFLGAVQCKEQSLSDNGLMQRADKPLSSCSICEKILKKIFTSIGNELSKDNIDRALKLVCWKSPGPMKKICMSFIKKYKAKLVNILKSARNPHEACKRLNLCKKAPRVSFVSVKKF